MNKSKIRIFISICDVFVVNPNVEPSSWFMYMVLDKRYIDRYNIKEIYK